MRNLLFMISLSLFTLFPIVSYAQVDAGVNVNQVISAEDLQRLRSQVDQLSRAMDNQPKKDESISKDKPQSKSLGDVADKALDMFSNTVANLAQSFSKIAPEIWRIMIKQQYAKAFGNIIFPFGIIIIDIIFYFIIKKIWILAKDASNEGYVYHLIVVKLFPLFTFVIVGCIFFNQVGESISMLINPEYYAVKDILYLIKGESPQ